MSYTKNDITSCRNIGADIFVLEMPKYHNLEVSQLVDGSFLVKGVNLTFALVYNTKNNSVMHDYRSVLCNWE